MTAEREDSGAGEARRKFYADVVELAGRKGAGTADGRAPHAEAEAGLGEMDVAGFEAAVERWSRAVGEPHTWADTLDVMRTLGFGRREGGTGREGEERGSHECQA